MPVHEKIAKADVVFWNEGPPAVIRSQVRRFAQALLMNRSASDDGATAVAPAPPVSIDINQFRLKPLADLQAMAEALPLRIPGGLTKSQLVYELLSFHAREGTGLVCEGVIELTKESFSMLRDPARSFRPGPDDIHFGSNMMRDLGLRPGQLVKVRVRAPRERDKYLSAFEVIEVEGIPAAEYQPPKDFDRLTPLFPDRRIHLEGEGDDFLAVRVLDLIAPLGMGQRGLIVARRAAARPSCSNKSPAPSATTTRRRNSSSSCSTNDPRKSPISRKPSVRASTPRPSTNHRAATRKSPTSCSTAPSAWSNRAAT